MALDRITLRDTATARFEMAKLSELTHDATPQLADLILAQTVAGNFYYSTLDELKTAVNPIPATTNWDIYYSNSGSIAAQRVNEFSEQTTVVDTDTFLLQKSDNTLMYATAANLYSYMEPSGTGGDIYYNSSGVWTTGRINELAEKTTPISTDVFLLQEAINNLKYITLTNLQAAILPVSTNQDIFYSNSGTITAQRINEFAIATPNDTDVVLVQEIGNTLKQLSWSNIKANLDLMPVGANQDILFNNSGTWTAQRIDEFTEHTTLADTDVFPVQTNAPLLKYITKANLASELDTLPTGTNGDYLVNVSGTWTSLRINELPQKNPPDVTDAFLLQEITGTHRFITYDHLKTAIGVLPAATNWDILHYNSGWTAQRVSEFTHDSTPASTNYLLIQDNITNELKYSTLDEIGNIIDPLPIAYNQSTLVGNGSNWVNNFVLRINPTTGAIQIDPDLTTTTWLWCTNNSMHFGSKPSSITGADYNACFGLEAGHSVTSGGFNTFIGRQSGSLVTTGTNNVCIGNNAGNAITSGTYNVIIGNNADAASALTNCIVIGNAQTVTSSYGLNIGGMITGNTNTDELSVNGELVVGDTHGSQEAQLHVYDNGTALDAVAIFDQDDFNLDGIIIKNQTATMTLSTDGVHLSQDDSGKFVVNAFHNSGTSTDMGFCNSGGNFGVGTISPAEKFTVNGTCRATDYNVNGSAGVSGSFTTTDGKTVTVTSGIITSIV